MAHRVEIVPELRRRLDDLLGPNSHRLISTRPDAQGPLHKLVATAEGMDNPAGHSFRSATHVRRRSLADFCFAFWQKQLEQCTSSPDAGNAGC